MIEWIGHVFSLNRKFSSTMSDPTPTDSSRIPTNRDGEAPQRRRIGCVDGIKKSAKDAGNALMQQKLKSWQPVMSPRYVSVYYCVCSCHIAGLSVPSVHSVLPSLQSVRLSWQYVILLNVGIISHSFPAVLLKLHTDMIRL